MKKEKNTNKFYNLWPVEIDGFDSLVELALDMRWSWNHYGDKLWRQLDPELWEMTQNPWVVLQTVAPEKLKTFLKDTGFRKEVNELLNIKRRKSKVPAWFQQNYPQSPLTCIAYFSMEFMLSEALPIYSGGLGNVAGDQLKAASDLGVPVIGVGLLYQQGYFRQIIDKDGSQQALYPYNDPGQLPITPLRKSNGDWLRLEITFPGYSVWLRAWQVQVGRVKLYLLDSNDAANFPAHRGITSELYGGGPDLRIKQEIILGIGGWRLLRALGIKPEVCHLNEGHAAFAVLERARDYIEETGETFETALAVTRVGNLFTTHTAVAAGFDLYSPVLVSKYLCGYAENKLGFAFNDLLGMGRSNPNDPSESFNMAYLAFRGSGAVNAVSRLHGKVSRRLFEPLFPRWPVNEIPVGHVTNGVHTPTWDSAEADKLWTEAGGKERWLGTTEKLTENIRLVSDERIWHFRNATVKSLVEYSRGRLARQLTESGASLKEVEDAKNIFDPNILTLGFARRFATYKRPNLLLHDPQRLKQILCGTQHPIQLIIAGKAHPQDISGQRLIQDWIHFIRQNEVRRKVVFLSDYDMLLTQQLVKGVDVWINTPRRPWEASGTSGMKVLVNGGLNLSELDGWWAEAYSPEVGWALGDGQEHNDDPVWDDQEANALYNLLENELIPEFYDRDENGIPVKWIKRVRESMALLTPRFSANRTVREYTERHYLPAAASYRLRTSDNGTTGKKLVNWKHSLNKDWDKIHFGDIRIETKGNQHIFEVDVHLSSFEPGSIKIELYADGANDDSPIIQEMKLISKSPASSGDYTFRAKVPSSRPATEYTARIIPYYKGAAVPLEAAQILWEK